MAISLTTLFFSGDSFSGPSSVIISVILVVLKTVDGATNHHPYYPNSMGSERIGAGPEAIRFYASHRPQYMTEPNYNSRTVQAHLTWKNRRQEQTREEEQRDEQGQKEKEKGETAAVEETKPIESDEVEDESPNESAVSPLDQLIEDFTTPEKLIPVINDLTFLTLVILHLPAIIPTILIPLAFFVVGCFLIPIVRVNYFINHSDDGEEGRSILRFSTATDISTNLLYSIQSYIV